jgi:hypothetical protein
VIGHILIGATAQATQFIGADLRPGLGNVEAAIAGEAREQNIFKAKLRGFTSCGHILHEETSLLKIQTSALQFLNEAHDEEALIRPVGARFNK